jgi:GNAT superfamily N-acetyltransferase
VSGRLSRWIGGLRTLPHDAALAYRRGGRGDLWTTLAHQSLYCVCRHGHLLIIAQALDSFRQVSPPPGVRIAEASISDWPALEAILTRRELNGFARRLAAGMVGLIAWRDGSPIGYTWVADRLLSFVTPCPIALPSNAAYLFDLYVHPGERSGGIGSALASARLELARARGFKEGWRMISPANGASLRTVEKTTGSGTRIVGEVRYVKILTRVHRWYRPGSTPFPSMS